MGFAGEEEGTRTGAGSGDDVIVLLLEGMEYGVVEPSFLARRARSASCDIGLGISTIRRL